MPDTPIDLSEGIQSVRLKVPTAEVPIPPEGFAQLHSPSPGELALRLPDGSVVAVGGGGGGGTNAVNLLGPNGQVLTNGTEPGVGIDISPIPPLVTRINGPLQGNAGRLYLPPPAVVSVSSAELLDLHNSPKVLVAAPGAGKAIIPLAVWAVSSPGSTPYTVTGASVVVQLWEPIAGGTRVASLNNNLFTQVGPRAHFYAGVNWDDSFGVENLNNALRLAVDDALVDGNGSLKLVIPYFVA